MSEQCNEKDLHSNMSNIAKIIKDLKQNICTVEREYYDYPDIKYVKKFNKFLNMSRNKILENDWGMPIAQISNELFESKFYQRYDDYVKQSKIQTNFSFHVFMTNFIHGCFYNTIEQTQISNIVKCFFNILKGVAPLVTLKIFSTGLVNKGTYHINDFLTIAKPSIRDFDIEKIPSSQLHEYEEVVGKSNSIIYYKYPQHTGGDNSINMQDRIQFIFVLFKLVKFQSLGGYNLTFDFYHTDYGHNYYFHYPRNDYLHTEFKKKDVEKFKKTYDFLIKNFTRFDFHVHNYKGRLKIALQTYHEALEQLGSISETTPYAVKIVNSLLIEERDNSKNRFVNRVFIFLYYLGIRNKKTKEILGLAYNWRSNYFHGAPTEGKKSKNPSLTENYIELFMLNVARLLIFTLLILKHDDGKKLTQLIDNTYTIEGIKKLESQLSLVRKYIPIYKNGIKIKENGLNIDILEC